MAASGGNCGPSVLEATRRIIIRRVAPLLQRRTGLREIKAMKRWASLGAVEGVEGEMELESTKWLA